MASKTLTPLLVPLVAADDIPDPPLASTLVAVGNPQSDEDGTGHVTGDDDGSAPPHGDPPEAIMSRIPLGHGTPVPLCTLADIDQAVAESFRAALQDPEIFSSHAALLAGFARNMEKILRDTVVEDHKAITHTFDGILVVMRRAIETLTTTSADASAVHADIVAVQLRNAVAALQDKGISVLGYPYSATVQGTSPQGFPVALTLQKHDAGALVEAITGLTGWLQAQGYTGLATTL